MNENRQQRSDNPNDRRRRLLDIREEEELERRRRAETVRAQKRAAYIREKKREQMIAWIKLIGVGLVVLIALIGIIVGISGSVGSKKKKAAEDEQRSEAEAQTKQLTAFSQSVGMLYDPENVYFPANAGELMQSVRDRCGTELRNDAAANKVTDYDAYTAEWVIRYGTDAERAALRERLIDMPISNMDYIFSQTDSADDLALGCYLHDTNIAYISAVSLYCTGTGDTSILDAVDSHTVHTADVSEGMSVRVKLEKALEYLFNGKNTGLKYDVLSSLAVVLSQDNNGTSSGKPSSIHTTTRSGYADTYINLRFNKAMRDIAALYTLIGEEPTAARYSGIADSNAAAIRAKLYDAQKQRFIGWIDRSDERHDLGDVFTNLLAVDTGVASDDQREAILSWLCGIRTIESDTIRGEDILSNGVAGYTASDGAFRVGTPEQLESADRTSLAANALAIRVLCAAGKEDKARAVAAAVSALYTEKGIGAFGSTPADGLIVGQISNAYFDISPDGRIVPRFGALTVAEGTEDAHTADFGIRGVKVGSTSINVFYGKEHSYITSDGSFEGSLSVGGFLLAAPYSIEVIDTSAATLTVIAAVEATTSDSGMLHIENISFGQNNALRITPVPVKKQ